jgi:uncharacterized protein (DUF302 family)
MSYYFSRTVSIGFDEAVEKVTENLKKEGFGVLTQIDVKETLKKKLNADFKNYKILGACNPPYAYKALQAEDKIGVMLPCNVVIIDQGQGRVEVTAVDPAASMMAVKNESLAPVAAEIGSKLQNVIAAV